MYDYEHGMHTWRSIEHHTLGRHYAELLEDLRIQHWEQHHLL